MKLPLLVGILVISVVFCIEKVNASIAPVVGIGINSESLKNGGTLGALEPTLEWSGSAELGEVELQGGAFVQIQDVDKPSDIPFSLWAKIKGTVSGVQLSARADSASNDLSEVDLDLKARAKDTIIRLLGRANPDKLNGEVFNVQVSHTFRSLVGDSSVNISPSYNFRTNRSNVNLGFSVMDTGVYIETLKQRLTLARNIGKGQIQPSVSLQGDVALAYKQVVGLGVATGTLTGESIGIKWSDGVMQAKAEMPVNGLYRVKPDDVKFAIRRVVNTGGLS